MIETIILIPSETFSLWLKESERHRRKSLGCLWYFPFSEGSTFLKGRSTTSQMNIKRLGINSLSLFEKQRSSWRKV